MVVSIKQDLRLGKLMLMLQLREQLSNKTGAAPSAAVPERCPRSFKPYEKSPVYRNGGELRSYQLEA